MKISTGKNFSCNNAKGQRKKSDFYETPYSITKQLLERESITGPVLEPSCGNGAIAKVLRGHGLDVIEKDIAYGQDFLLETGRYTSIVTNPPFSLAYEFILKCKEVTDYFALLLPLSYLHGKQRYDNIYSDKKFPVSTVYVFTRYPMLGEPLREDGKYHTGMMVYAWFIWNKHSESNKPTIEWIDNHSFVLGSRDSSN